MQCAIQQFKRKFSSHPEHIMDPSIMKLLEEDEDESMHSVADVEAFQAALNRDIGGNASTSQPSNSDTAVLSQESNHTSGQSLVQWQTASQEQNINSQTQQNVKSAQQQDQCPSGMELKQHKMSNQQAAGMEQAGNPVFRGKQVPSAVLLPTIVPQLDKDRAMQLHTLYAKLKKNEIPNEGFVRHEGYSWGPDAQVGSIKTSITDGQFQVQLQSSFAQLQQKSSNSPADPSHIPPFSSPNED